jgi:AcrR family transcriptional regulator
MASTDISAVSERDEPVTPQFRRAKPADALQLALDTFLREERLDMQALAAQLDVSPATLYRWFGSRGQLLADVLELIAERFSATARAEAHGEGDEYTCDYARRLMTAGAAFGPARSFVAREPQLGLRLMLAREGAVHRVLSRELAEVIAQTRPPEEASRLQERAHVIVQVATALVWATFMVGDEPQIDGAVEIIRMVLASGPAD